MGWPDLLRRLEPENIFVCFLKTIVSHSSISPEAKLYRLNVKGRTILIFLSIITNVVLTATVAVPRNSVNTERSLKNKSRGPEVVLSKYLSVYCPKS